MLEASFELFVPLVVAKIIDNGIAKGDNIYVLKMGGALLLLAIIGLTCSLTAQYFAAKAAAGFGTEVRHALFKHIQTFSYDEIDRLGKMMMSSGHTGVCLLMMFHQKIVEKATMQILFPMRKINFNGRRTLW